MVGLLDKPYRIVSCEWVEDDLLWKCYAKRNPKDQEESARLFYMNGYTKDDARVKPGMMVHIGKPLAED